jgi:hypothetical protein
MLGVYATDKGREDSQEFYILQISLDKLHKNYYVIAGNLNATVVNTLV